MTASRGHASTNKCTGIVGCSCRIFELNRCINSNGQFLGCDTTAILPAVTVKKSHFFPPHSAICVLLPCGC